MNFRGCVPMSLASKGRLAALLFCFLICVGCGDVYRPTILPNPVPIPNPQNFHTVFTVNQNGSIYPGTGMQIDVSGDSNAGVTKVAMGPVHAAVQTNASGTSASIWVANSISDSVSVFTQAQSSGSIGGSFDVNLPPGYNPVFVNSTETSKMYVASVASPNPDGAPGNVSVVNSNDVVTNTIPVGIHPMAVAETPDTKKLYVVNQFDGTVTVLNTVDLSTNTILGNADGVGSSPRWVIARSDSARVYVLANDGTLTTINTTLPTDQTIQPSVSVGAGPDSFYYDGRYNRLLIPNPTNSTTAIYDVTADPPTLLQTIDLTKPIPPAGTSTPCPATGCFPLSVTPLTDGTRTYIASYYLDNTSANCTQNPCVQAQVTVFNSLTYQVLKAISLPEVSVSAVGNCASARFRLSAASSIDSSKVYVSSCDAGGVAVIRTSDDTYATTVLAPVSGFSPPAVSISAAVQSGSNTTYSYTLTSGMPLFLGMPISITGIANPGDTTLNPDNGTFNIIGLAAGTFTVSNPTGVSTTAPQTAIGLGQPPPQNPMFMVAGP
jgi:DNA-binding beta-propeller fold protein YncE